MKIKRFVADSFPEAMKQAEEQMGNDAIILHSRKFRKGGFFGLFAKEKCEITVAIDNNYGNSISLPSSSANNRTGNKSVLRSEKDSSILEVMEEIKGMKYMVEGLREQMAESQFQARSRQGKILHKALMGREVDEKLANKIVKTVETRMKEEELSQPSRVREMSIQVIAELFKTPQGIEFRDRQPRIVTLIGPTGVGKTTTIAKLAAKFSLGEGKKVALITIDTYRIAAVEQLKTYTDIIGLPLEVVFKPQDLKTAIDRFLSYDIILIDTAGRSPRNEDQMADLVKFIEAANPDETFLVLSATTRTSDLQEALSKFGTLNIDKIIFTKLDETTCYGPILNVVTHTRKRLSYVTNGQNVPDDIELPDSSRLARLVVGDDLLA
ncbi:MAG: flagellar biosynthesis protein FlhF [Syntrophomonadaceae bacterium]|nr:flagellar biosynthesis protein FlhF [Syntrophomonadaceae bacterium]